MRRTKIDGTAICSLTINRSVSSLAISNPPQFAKMKTKLITLAACVMLAGCIKTETSWGSPTQYDAPLTDAQKQMIAEHAQKILAATPRSLAGDDQDWDDAIQQAHRDARAIYAPLVQFEYHREGGFFLTADFAQKTGRVRYVKPQPEAAQPEASK